MPPKGRGRNRSVSVNASNRNYNPRNPHAAGPSNATANRFNPLNSLQVQNAQKPKNKKRTGSNAPTNRQQPINALLPSLPNKESINSKNNSQSIETNKGPETLHGISGRVQKLAESYGFVTVTDKRGTLRQMENILYFQLSKCKVSALQLSVGTNVCFAIKIHNSQEYEIFDVGLKYSRTDAEIYGYSLQAITEEAEEESGDGDAEYTQVQSRSKPTINYINCTAVIVNWVPGKDFCFVKPLNITLPDGFGKEDNLYLHKSRLNCLGLELVPGDMLEIQINPKQTGANRRAEFGFMTEKSFTNKTKYSDIYVTASELLNFFLNSEEATLTNELSQKRSALAVIRYLCKFNGPDFEKLKILEAVVKLARICFQKFGTPYTSDLIACLYNSGFYKKGNFLYSYYKQQTKEQSEVLGQAMQSMDAEEIGRFILASVEMQQICARGVHRILKEFSTQFSKDFILDFAYLVSKNTSTAIEDLGYKEVSLVPTAQELTQMMIDERNFLNINPVNTKGSYSSPETYIDTYFNLLRFDCFFNLLSGIKNYLAGNLDLRDMNVAVEGAFMGLYQERNSSGNVFIITAKLLQKNNKAYVDSRSFLFGNLVAVSFTGLFNDIVWATVVHREDKIQEGLITLCLEYATESNTLPFVETLERLIRHSTRFVIAESPTYYNAYRPVLKALQKLDPDKIPFGVELICGQPQSNPMSPHTGMVFCSNLLYVDNSESEYDGQLSLVNHLGHEFEEVEHFSATAERSESIKCVLDPSQEKAMELVLQNRVAIVQGPPGTGKTYLGVHVANVLLNLLTNDEYESTDGKYPKPIEGPIVLMTYKNHALDEFSKHILSISHEMKRPGNFIRVGSRSGDEEIAKYSLRNALSRQKNIHERTLEDQLGKISKQIKVNLKSFIDRCMVLSGETVLKNFDNAQLSNLLQGFDKKKECSDHWKKNFEYQKKNLGLESIGDILYHGLSNQYHQDLGVLYDLLLKEAFLNWIPSDEETEAIDKEESRRRMEDIKKQKLYERISESDLSPSDDLQCKDPDEIRRLIEERTEAAGGKRNFEVIDPANLITCQVSTKGSSKKCLQSLQSSTVIASGIDLDDLRYISNLWDLTMKERLGFLQAMLMKQSKYASNELTKLLDEYEAVASQLKKLREEGEIKALKAAKVVAMTVTGAALKVDILNAVKPAVIIVEEAGEINEAQLLALLGPHVRHLILIGDHQQLRPQVECYSLVKKYHFDVSMMERLINNNLPYATLETQNRMRPEIAKYLLDIYPDLKNNPRVSLNPPVSCMDKNIFFWSHTFPEQGGRSHTNSYEAKSVVHLVNYFHRFNKYPLKKITVLSAYKGQTAVIRKEIAEAGLRRDPNDKLEVQTIDMYQGDENEIVIVSLVRSNPNNKIGFLSILNRRCVAQSRSKSGVYFLGNADTLRNSEASRKADQGPPIWKTFLSDMESDGCLGPKLTIRCKNHQDCFRELERADQLPIVPFCTLTCSHAMPCGIHDCEVPCQPYHEEKHAVCYQRVNFTHKCGIHVDERFCYQNEKDLECNAACTFIYEKESTGCPYNHPCTRKCEPSHPHDYCLTTINYSCKMCGSPLHRSCYQSENEIYCHKKVEFIFKHCGVHVGRKMCFEDEKQFRCTNPCLKKMEPCGHDCPKACEPSHAHAFPDAQCMKEIKFRCKKCNNENTRKCFQKEEDINCEHRVVFTYPKCGRHMGEKKCHEDENKKECAERCGKVLRKCGHKCLIACRKEHDDEKEICKTKVDFIHFCGTKLIKECYQREDEVACNGACVKRIDPCGHFCPKKCQPTHSHNRDVVGCDEEVKFPCLECGFLLTKKCSDKCEVIKCTNKVEFKFQACNHFGKKKCHESANNYTCGEQCGKILTVCGHNCKQICGSAHSHNTSKFCVEPIDFNHHCGADLVRKCNQKEEDIKCAASCCHKLTCGHGCPKNCDPPHEHNFPCKLMVHLNCSSCGIKLKKPCHLEEDKVECPKGRQSRLCAKCGVESEGPCLKSNKKFECNLPCKQKLTCGHICSQKCHEACSQGQCQPCIQEKREKERIEAEEREIMKKKEIAMLKNQFREDAQRIRIDAAFRNSWAVEVKDRKCDFWYKMEELALKFLKPEAGVIPKITSIRQTTNLMASKRWLEKRSQLLDPRNVATLCHFTSESPPVVQARYEKGFHDKFQKVTHNKNRNNRRKGPAPASLTGNMIFDFASPTVHYKENFTFNVLVCEVLTGNAQTVSEMSKIPASLQKNQFDSVYIPPNNKTSGKYVVYDPFHIVVTAQVTFTLEKTSNILSGLSSSQHGWISSGFSKTTYQSSREIEFGSEDDYIFRMAESQFRRMANKNSNYRVKSVDIFRNPDLEKKFFAKKEEFKREPRGKNRAKEILSFHGTKFPDPEKIMKENFLLDKIKRTAYGYGIYFSEYPDVSIGYGHHLILARILPGIEYSGSCDGKSCQTFHPPHDCHLVRPDKNSYSEMVVIQNTDQILPMCIIHYENH